MYDDPIGALESELLAAARRRAAGGRWRPAFGTALTAVAAGVALIVAVGAVALLGGHGGRSGAAQTHTAVAAANPGPLHIERYVSALLGGSPSPALSSSVERQLGLNRYNASEFVTGVVRASGGLRIQLWEFGVKPIRGGGIDELAATVGGRVIAHATGPSVRTRGLLVPLGGSAAAVIVPNDVRRVSFLSVRVMPHRAVARGNIVAFRVTGSKPLTVTNASRMIWYGRRGAVLRRVGPAH